MSISIVGFNLIHYVTQLLISGYFREFQRRFNGTIIPADINDVCLAFYFYATDKFSKTISSPLMDIYDDGVVAKLGQQSIGHIQLLESSLFHQ